MPSFHAIICNFSGAPFYRAIELSINVIPFILPCTPRQVLGYVDDTSFLVYDDSSIIEGLKILKNFELASSIKLNKHKTMLFRMDSWKNRQLLSAQNVDIIHGNIKILGINYSHTYDLAIQDSWERSLIQLKIKINILMNRKLNLYQKAIIINCMICQKFGILVPHTLSQLNK